MRRYDITARTYDERYREEQMAKYTAALECISIDGETVLDVGCGTGLLFNLVAEKAKTVLGIDLAKQLLVKANERSRKFANVYVVQADADHLPIREDLFSRVFAFTVLQNLPRPSRVLIEIARTSKSGANITVTGLKRKISKGELTALMDGAGMHPFSIVDNDILTCYIAIGVLGEKFVYAPDSLYEHIR